MDDPILSQEERQAINSGRWFSTLSPTLRHDILRCTYVRRFKDGDQIAARGDPPDEWVGCAKGAVRISSTSLAGRQVTLAYIEPGVWSGDIAVFDGAPRSHDAYAHGSTTLVCVSQANFKRILSDHVELYEALMRLQARRQRQLMALVEDLNTLPLRARLAKQLLFLAHSYSKEDTPEGEEIRIGLHLAQEELAQLLGASRQRVNQELKAMERDGLLRVETSGLVIRDRKALLAIVQEQA